jgi:hypothetical protein
MSSSITTNTDTTTNNIILSGDPNLDAIMRNIELKTEHKVRELLQQPCKTTNTAENAKAFTNELSAIMISGANEFKEKTGRGMTYSEMRAMYG